MRLKILYDNRALEGFRADWGFACLVEAEEVVLFDTGADGSVLQHNMAQAGVDPAAIDIVVISHDHWDHAGGLSYVSRENSRARLVLLPSFGPELREAAGKLAIEDVTERAEISPGIWSTGPVGTQIPEQAVALNTGSGIVVITGCAHPGVDALLEPVAPLGKVHGVLGGFHGFSNLAALEGIPFLAACHCTQHQTEIAERFPESYVDIMAGTVLEF